MGLVLLAGSLGACAQEPAGDQWLGEAACVAGQCVVTSDERRVQMTLPETVPAMQSFALALQLDGFAAVRDVVVDFAWLKWIWGRTATAWRRWIPVAGMARLFCRFVCPGAATGKLMWPSRPRAGFTGRGSDLLLVAENNWSQTNPPNVAVAFSVPEESLFTDNLTQCSV